MIFHDIYFIPSTTNNSNLSSHFFIRNIFQAIQTIDGTLFLHSAHLNKNDDFLEKFPETITMCIEFFDLAAWYLDFN